ncbi:MAG: hypothetical protein AB7P40_01015 [Chloroflexota bacterium]
MCIPINLDVPVVTHDQHEIGIARDIICPGAGDPGTHTSAVPGACNAAGGQDDLWLRVSRSALPDLFIPFAEIAETRADGVQLQARQSELTLHQWEGRPSALAVPV